MDDIEQLYQQLCNEVETFENGVDYHRIYRSIAEVMYLVDICDEMTRSQQVQWMHKLSRISTLALERVEIVDPNYPKPQAL